MKARHYLAGSLSALALTGIVSLASASSHREAPAIGFDPAADNTDVWAWVNDGAHDKMTIVTSYNPLEEPSGGPNYNSFSDDVLYEIHLTRGNKSLDDVVTYQVQFDSTDIPNVNPADLSAPLGGGKEFFSQLSGKKQTYSIVKLTHGKGGSVKREVVGQGLPIAPVNIGPNTNKIVYNTPKYDEGFMRQVHQPPRLQRQRRARSGPGRRTTASTSTSAASSTSRTSSAAPRTTTSRATTTTRSPSRSRPRSLTADGQPPKAGASDDNTVGVWASASRRQVRILHRGGGESNFGSWVQVSRLGLPLINEAVIGLQDKDKYNRTKPAKDVANFGAYFLNPVIVRDAEAVGIYKALGVPQSTVDALKSNRLDIIDTINLKRLGP